MAISSAPIPGVTTELKLPDETSVYIDDLNLTLKELIDFARGHTEDARITHENFGVTDHFFFVNRSTGTLIDNSIPAEFRLNQMLVKSGQTIELCLVPFEG
jgi:hypothetical protein